MNKEEGHEAARELIERVIEIGGNRMDLDDLGVLVAALREGHEVAVQVDRSGDIETWWIR